MKSTLAVGTLMLWSTLLCTAGPVVGLHESFASGAVFNGTVTFLDDYSNLTAVDGWLTGGSYGNDHLTWIWNPSTNYASAFGSQFGGNFLMDGTNTSDYHYWITLTWDFSDAPNLQISTPAGILSEYGGNNVTYSDPLVSGTFGNVPEPGTSIQFVGGLGALAALLLRRRPRL